MSMRVQLIAPILGLLFIGCSQSNQHTLQDTVDNYYQTYAERVDFEYFLTFYDSAMVLEDIVLGEKIEGIENFRAFFDWPNPNFEMRDSVALIVTNQVFGENEVITSGYFTPFSWGGVEVEAMLFMTTLTFGKDKKIIRHVDWINYPSTLIDYQTRKNSNDWILDE